MIRQVISTLFARRTAASALTPTRPSSLKLPNSNSNQQQLHTTNANKKMAHLLAGEMLVVNRAGEKKPAEEYLKGKVVALYFSAMWCPPCRMFTPKLKKYYEDLKAKGKNFEVIFVSRDRTAEDLLEYYKDHHAEWAYLEFGSPKIDELLKKFEVQTIPTLRVVKADGKVVVSDARNEVANNENKDAVELFEQWEAFYGDDNKVE